MQHLNRMEFKCSNNLNSSWIIFEMEFNPHLTNGFSHDYQLDESTFILRGVRKEF